MFHQEIYKIIPISTLHFGRCYTVEPLKKFYAFDNMVIVFKDDINLFVHGIGQEIGIIGNFYPVPPTFFSLSKNWLHKLDIQAKEKRIDEKLGCNSKIDEKAYYGCVQKTMSMDYSIQNCTVPMFDNIFRER